jgi:hypothetical protein
MFRVLFRCVPMMANKLESGSPGGAMAMFRVFRWSSVAPTVGSSALAAHAAMAVPVRSDPREPHEIG